MHSAPVVNYPVGRSRDAGRLLLSFWALGAACAGAATLTGETLGDWRALLLTASVLLAGVAVWREHRQSPTGILRFDGHYWSPSGAAPVRAGRAQVCVDLQFLMLLRLAEPGLRPRWLWLEQRSDAARWRDLRRAVYSRAPTASDAGKPASTSVATPAPAQGRPTFLR